VAGATPWIHSPNTNTGRLSALSAMAWRIWGAMAEAVAGLLAAGSGPGQM
jgi:hypothetical protein